MMMMNMKKLMMSMGTYHNPFSAVFFIIILKHLKTRNQINDRLSFGLKARF